MDLHILDASNYIYAGSYGSAMISRGVRETNGSYTENAAPIGGVRFLLRQAFKLSKSGIVMPVFDRTPEIKRGMYEDLYGDPYGYKANRNSTTKSKNKIKQQADYAEWILRECGFPVQAVEQYESDDVIYTLVEVFSSDFEHVYVHTRDSDLSFLVKENVTIEMVGDKVGKHIDMYNYNSVVDKDMDTLYNTIHFRKMMKGDMSDNIPPIGMDWAPLFDAVIPNEDYRKLGDLELSRKYIKDAVLANPTKAGANNILRVFNIIVPLFVPVKFLNEDEQELDKEMMDYYRMDWQPDMDKWGHEDRLLEFIDSCYD